MKSGIQLDNALFSAVDEGQEEPPVGAILDNVGCQERFTLGKDYTGQGNTTVSGLACLKWSDTERGAFLGDHNYCRNPYGESGGVSCFTADSNAEHCAV